MIAASTLLAVVRRILIILVALCADGARAGTLSISVVPDPVEKSLYQLTLSNPSNKPVEVLGFKVRKSVFQPWRFALTTKPHPGFSATTTTTFAPYVIAEIELVSKEHMLVILPAEFAGRSVPPKHDAENIFTFMSGGRYSFPVSLPHGPSKLTVLYYNRSVSGEFVPVTVKN